jgi:CHASE2 domain-containing sensor protein
LSADSRPVGENLVNTQSKKLGTRLGFAAFGVAALTMVAWFRQINQVDIPENRIVFAILFLTALVLAISAFVKRTRWFGAIPALLAIVIGGFATTGIQVGQTMPEFKALNRKGEWFDSASLDGKPTLIKFFRGHW